MPAQPTVKLEQGEKNKLPLLTHEQRSRIKQQSDPRALGRERGREREREREKDEGSGRLEDGA